MMSWIQVCFLFLGTTMSLEPNIWYKGPDNHYYYYYNECVNTFFTKLWAIALCKSIHVNAYPASISNQEMKEWMSNELLSVSPENDGFACFYNSDLKFVGFGGEFITLNPMNISWWDGTPFNSSIFVYNENEPNDYAAPIQLVLGELNSLDIADVNLKAKGVPLVCKMNNTTDIPTISPTNIPSLAPSQYSISTSIPALSTHKKSVNIKHLVLLIAIIVSSTLVVLCLIVSGIYCVYESRRKNMYIKNIEKRLELMETLLNSKNSDNEIKMDQTSEYNTIFKSGETSVHMEASLNDDNDSYGEQSDVETQGNDENYKIRKSQQKYQENAIRNVSYYTDQINVN